MSAPEKCGAPCRMDPTLRCDKPKGHALYHESAPVPGGPKENGYRWQFSDPPKK